VKHNPRVVQFAGEPRDGASPGAALQVRDAEGPGGTDVGFASIEFDKAGGDVLRETARSASSLAVSLTPLAGDRLRVSGSLDVIDSLFSTWRQGAALATLAEEGAAALANYLKRRFTLRLKDSDLVLGDSPAIMGILNVTPDSFYDGGRFFDTGRAVDHALEMAAEGAAIIDVGGYSTRPGADDVTAEEERSRVEPVVRSVAEACDVPVSIDTFRAYVAEAALDAGAAMVNDIFGLSRERRLAKLVSAHGGALVAMHIQGGPPTMQQAPHYENVMAEICASLRNSVTWALQEGLAPEQVVVDPGIGFGKTLGHNLEILGNIEQLHSLGHPVLLGASRKSFIGMITGCETEERLWGTLATAALATRSGVHILRVHDVREIRQAVSVATSIAQGEAGYRALSD